MKSQSSDILSYLGSANLSSNNFKEPINVSLVNKLKNVEQCLVEKEFLHGLDIVREIIKEYPGNSKLALNNHYDKCNKNDDEVFGSLTIKKKMGRVILNNELINLSTNEFSLLLMLVENPDEIVSRDKLHHSLLKTEYDGLNRSIDNTISRLRKKLGDQNISQLKIKSIRGKGYLFSSEQW